jgi:uncharacterized protein (DUF58 family)
MTLRPTPRGVAALLFTLAVLGVAARTGHNLLYLVAATLSATLLLGVAGPILGLRGVTVTRTPPEELFAGWPARGTWQLTGGPWGCDGLHVVEDGGLANGWCPRLDAGQTVEVSGTWLCPRRGPLALTSLTLHSHQPFGLLVASARRDAPGEVLVWPGPEAGTPPTEPPRRAVPGPPADLRPWREGDAWRDVHPLASARSLEPVVRVREDEVLDEGVLLVPPLQGAALEAALRHAAAAVLDAWATGRPVGLRVGATLLPPRTGDAWRRRLLDALALVGEPTLAKPTQMR